MRALSHCRRTIYRRRGGACPSRAKSDAQRITSRYHPPCPTDKETRRPFLVWECGSLLPLFRLLPLAGRHRTTAPSSLDGKTLCTVRRRDDLRAGSRLLVRGTATHPDADRRRRVPVPQLSAGQGRSVAQFRQKKRSVNFQSIWTAGPPVVPATSARRATTARATL